MGFNSEINKFNDFVGSVKTGLNVPNEKVKHQRLIKELSQDQRQLFKEALKGNVTSEQLHDLNQRISEIQKYAGDEESYIATSTRVTNLWKSLSRMCSNFFKGRIGSENVLNSIKSSKMPELFIVMDLVSKEGKHLEFVDEKYKSNKDVVLAAVMQNGLALRDASVGLQDDEEVVLPAIKENGDALKYASKRLQDELKNYNDSYFREIDL